VDFICVWEFCDDVCLIYLSHDDLSFYLGIMAFLSIQGLQMGGVERELTRARGAAPGFKVAVLGAAGGIGQPLSLLLKMNPLVSTLHLYDVFNTPGVTADLSHTNTSAVVCESFLFPDVFFTI
jgi:hypothetical protein